MFGWGSNVDYQLIADEDVKLLKLPVSVKFTNKNSQIDSGWSACCGIAAGARHSAAVCWDGSLYTWGAGCRNSPFNWGDPLHTAYLPGTTALLGVGFGFGEEEAVTSALKFMSSPYSVMGPALADIIEEKRRSGKFRRARERMEAAKKAAGEEPDYGNYDDYLSDTEPEPLPERARVKVDTVSIGEAHTLALTMNERLFSFGLNRFGECGVGGDSVVSDDRKVFSPTAVEVDEDFEARKEAEQKARDNGEEWDDLEPHDLNYRVSQISAGCFNSMIYTVHSELRVFGMASPGAVGQQPTLLMRPTPLSSECLDQDVSAPHGYWQSYSEREYTGSRMLPLAAGTAQLALSFDTRRDAPPEALSLLACDGGKSWRSVPGVNEALTPWPGGNKRMLLMTADRRYHKHLRPGAG